MDRALLDRINNLLDTHGGRDKIVKVLHYGSRIFIERAKERGDVESAKNLEAFRQAMGSARRVGRFFMSLNIVPGLLDHLSIKTYQSENKVMWVMLLSAHISDFFYYFVDNIPFFVDFNLLPINRKFSDWCYDFVGSWTWMVSVVVWIIYELRELRRQMNIRHLDEKKELERKESIKQTIITLISYFADLQLAIYFCFPNWKNNWSSKWIGVFGMINGAIGIYKRWK